MRYEHMDGQKKKLNLHCLLLQTLCPGKPNIIQDPTI